MAIYATLGISQAIAFFFMGVVFAFFTYAASKNLHRAAIKRVIHAPMSFFETTPLGRIMNRFAKDVDTLDNMLGDALRMFCNTLSNIIGAVILISILLPWFLIAVASISLIYYFYAVFYRSSARELKVSFFVCQIYHFEYLVTNNFHSVWMLSSGRHYTLTSPSRCLALLPSVHMARRNDSRRTTRIG
jgi:ABC-type multidrug transport system fused ATPase/permease subunit